MAKLKKEDLDIDLLDKLYQNLTDTGKIVRRLFIVFFTLMILISALAFEPEIFHSKKASTPSAMEPQKSITKDSKDNLKKITQSSDNSETPISIFGLKLPRGAVLKYSSLLLGMLYFFLAVYITYLDFIRKEFIKSYSELYSKTGEKDSSLLERVRIPAFHTVLGELSAYHPRKSIQIIFQIFDFIKSLFLYVLPMVVVIMLLGEGLKRATSKFLITIFFISPILVIVAIILLTREWFIATGNFFREYILALFRNLLSLRKGLFRKKKRKKLPKVKKEPVLLIVKIGRIMATFGTVVSLIVAIISIINFISKYVQQKGISDLFNIQSKEIIPKEIITVESLSRKDFKKILRSSSGLVEFSSLDQIDYDNIKTDKKGYMRAVIKEDSGFKFFVQAKKSGSRTRLLVLKFLNNKRGENLYFTVSYTEVEDGQFIYNYANLDEELKNWRDFVKNINDTEKVTKKADNPYTENPDKKNPII
jgi:hypothetical protein